MKEKFPLDLPALPVGVERVEPCPNCGEARRPHYPYECIQRMKQQLEELRAGRSIW